MFTVLLLVCRKGLKLPLVASALFLSIYFNKVFVTVGDMNIRLGQIVCVFVSFVYSTKIRWSQLSATAGLLFAFLLSFALSSLIFAESSLFSLRKLSIVALYAYSAMAFVTYVRQEGQLQLMFDTFVTIGNIVVLTSLVGFVLYQFGRDVGFTRREEELWLEGPMINANIFGSTAAVIGLLNLHSFHVAEKSQRVIALSIIMCAISVFFSYTRAAWIGFTVFGLIFIAVIARVRQIEVWKTLGIAFLLVIIVLTLVSVMGQKGYDVKFESLIDFEGGSGYYRIVAMDMGIEAWNENPLFGGGFQNFEYAMRADRDPDQMQMSSLFIQVLAYGGILAATILLLVILSLHARSVRLIRYSNNARHIPEVLALLLSIDLLLLTYQITSGIWLPFFWFIVFFLIGFLDLDRSTVYRNGTIIERANSSSN